jgi:hypothetical protein
MYRSIPGVEIPNYTHALSVRSPHCESYTAMPLMSDRMRAELVVNTLVLAFAKKMEIDIA